MLATGSGCPSRPSPAPATPDGPVASPSTQRSEPLRLLVVDDPPLAEALAREWAARDAGSLDLRQETGEQLVERSRGRLDADLVIYPSRMLGTLVEAGRLIPLPEFILEDEQWARDDIFSLLRQQEMTWGTQVYAAPFGSPQLTLIYRGDLFDRFGLKPPATWSDYDQLVQRLGQADVRELLAPADDGAAGGGVIEPLGPGWACHVFLARAATYTRHRSYYSTLFDFRTMEPLVDRPPFVRALEEVVRAAANGSPAARNLTPQAAQALFFQGKAAMVWAWPHGTAESSPAPEPRGDELGIRFAELPGSREVYHFGGDRWETRSEEDDHRVPLLAVAGRLGSVTTECRRTRAALSALVWMTGRTSSGQIASRSRDTTLFRFSHQAVPQVWTGRQVTARASLEYAEQVAATQGRPLWLVSLRIPGQHLYLAALDEAVRAAVAGQQAPREALSEAAGRWREITDALGPAAQRRAYQRSLGLED